MTGLSRQYTPHVGRVRVLQAGAGKGDSWADPRDVVCWIVDEQKQVRDSSGSEAISNTQVSVNIEEFIPVGSLFTVWPGEPDEREARVIAVNVFRHERLPSSRTLFLE